jgi:hypothetical protein
LFTDLLFVPLYVFFSRSLHEAQLRFVPVTCVVAMIFSFTYRGIGRGMIFIIVFSRAYSRHTKNPLGSCPIACDVFVAFNMLVLL